MITVYVLYDCDRDQLYTGMTNNLVRRLAEHKRGQSFYTKQMSSIKLLYKEECANYKKGRTREKYLKSGIGREFLRSLL